MLLKPVVRFVRCRSIGERAAPRIVAIDKTHVRIGGVALRVEPMLLLATLLAAVATRQPLRAFGWTLALVVASLSIELIRARAVTSSGGRAGILLTPLGGLLVGLPCEVAGSVRVRLALTGPALHLLFAVLLGACERWLHGTAETAAFALSRMHLVLGVVNLLPAPPFDAGHALETTLGRRAPGAVFAIGIASIALAFFALTTRVQMMWLCVPLAVATLSTIQSYTHARALRLDHRGAAGQRLAAAQRARFSGDNDSAVRVAAEALGHALSPPFRFAAADELALAHLGRGDVTAATQVLDVHVPKQLQEPLTLAVIALASGDAKLAARVLLHERERGEHRAESTRVLCDALVAAGQVGDAVRVIVEDQRLLSREELEQAISYLGDTEQKTARTLLQALVTTRGVAATS